jgi:NADPH-dependent 2,4-dienoyl-CoA reductase/sulfur reductase-like enzyme
MTQPKPRIAILGAGPTGLEAALAAADGGFPFILYEAAPTAAGHVRSWGHVRLFTPWEMDVSPRMRRHLAAAGQTAPGGAGCPTGSELADRLFEPLAALPAVAPHLRLGTRVLGVGREGLLKHEEIATAERGRRPFRLLMSDAAGREWTEAADVVIDATGTYGHPNSLGDGGIPAPGERALAGAIRRDIPDPAREAADWAGKTVLLAGAGHSAQTAARDLAALAREAPGTRVIWALRKDGSSWGSPAGDPLPERAALAAEAAALAGGASPAVAARRGVVVEEVSRPNGRLEVVLRNGAGRERLAVDRILALTGFVGDHQLYRQLQVHECYATCGPINLSAALLGAGAGDCLGQTTHGVATLTNPEPGFYILGSKSYGRNNTFLMRVGWEQVGEVFGALGGREGDREVADS